MKYKCFLTDKMSYPFFLIMSSISETYFTASGLMSANVFSTLKSYSQLFTIVSDEQSDIFKYFFYSESEIKHERNQIKNQTLFTENYYQDYTKTNQLFGTLFVAMPTE